MLSSGEAIAGRTRAGGRVLSVLSDALNASILRALPRGPLPVSELAQHLGPTSRTTRFSRLRDLEQLGIIVREKRPGVPPVAYCSLSPAGRGLLPVVTRFAEWLATAPQEPSGPDEVAGERAIKALATAWETDALRWLAERPCSLTELNALSPDEVTYHKVRNARESLSTGGLIAPVQSGDRAQPYALTEWARWSAGCIAAAIRWERTFLEGTTQLSPAEIETLLHLLLPLVRMDDDLDLSVTVDEGHITTHASRSEGGQSSRLSGPAESWIEALVDGRGDTLRMQGGIHLTTSLACALHEACAQLVASDTSNLHNPPDWTARDSAARENRTAPICSSFAGNKVQTL